MRYKVVVIKNGVSTQTIECANQFLAQKTAEDLKAAFPRAIKTGEMTVIIETE